MAAYCEICESIGKGQLNKESYRIWTIWKRESVLAYWYVVLYDSAYRKTYDMTSLEEVERVMDEWTDKAVDIRTLPNYKELSGGEILFNRKRAVVPLIREAVRKGYIVPLR